MNLKEGVLGVEALMNGEDISKASVLVRKNSVTWVTLLAGRNLSSQAL